MLPFLAQVQVINVANDAGGVISIPGDAAGPRSTGITRER